jgi:creatinine amidohydrolase
MDIRWDHLTAEQLRQLAAAPEAIVVVPVAAMEQHGPHLPVMVDSLLCSAVAERATRQVLAQRPVVVAPTVWSGLSEHHMPFGGTITLDYPTFHALLRCVCRSLERHGFGRVLLLNGHGGNEAALRVVVEQLSTELEMVLATVTYWHLAAERFRAILERQSGVRHACEAETSMILALRPDLVDQGRFAEARTAEDEGGAAGRLSLAILHRADRKRRARRSDRGLGRERRTAARGGRLRTGRAAPRRAVLAPVVRSGAIGGPVSRRRPFTGQSRACSPPPLSAIDWRTLGGSTISRCVWRIEIPGSSVGRASGC